VPSSHSFFLAFLPRNASVARADPPPAGRARARSRASPATERPTWADELDEELRELARNCEYTDGAGFPDVDGDRAAVGRFLDLFRKT
jgi:hypothetical protein